MLGRAVTSLLVVGVLASAGLTGSPAAVAARSGCVPTAGSIPTGAATASIPDVDGDGVRDTEYSTEQLPGGGYDYGIETASGHLSRIHETMPGTGDHGGWTARIVHGTVVTVIDDGRSAKVFTFSGCGFHPVRNAQGRQYTFSISGYSGSGTGVACVVRGGARWLYGEQATRSSGDTWDVRRTDVVVAARGSTARNGASETVGRRLAYSGSKVQTAFGSSCGAVARVHNSGD